MIKALAKKRFSKGTIAIALVLAIVATLWFSVPAQALTITFTPTPPSSGTLGSTYTFTVKVDVENTDLLPIDHIDFTIYNAANSTYRVDCANLPLVAMTKSYPSANGNVTVTAVPGTNWAQASGSRYGYGYGYQSGTWYTPPLGSGTTSGYGYMHSPYIGPTSITYTITWTIPSSWQTGTYEILFLVYGDNSVAFTTPTRPSFTISAYVPSPPAPPEPGVTDVSDSVDEDGVFTEEVTAESEDGQVIITIDEGITGLTAEGEPITELSIVEMEEEDIPLPPEEGHVIGVTYDIGPSGATFDTPITLTFNYDPDDLPEGVSETDLVIAIWDEAAGEWVEFPSVVDPVTHTVTATVTHFTTFAIIVPPPVEEEEVITPPVEEEEVVTPPVEEEEVITPPVEEEEEEEEVVTPPVEEEEEEEEVVTPAVVEDEEGLAWWIWLIVGLGSATVVGLLVYFFWWRRRLA